MCIRDRRQPDAPKQNPYRGLASFQHDEAHLFFGREALTAEVFQRFESLWETPGATRMLTVLGPSGSGKSSVARAGLLAALAQSPVPGPDPLRFVLVKPGERPIESLARALVPLLPKDATELSANRQLAVEKLLADTHEQGLRRFAADLPKIDRSPLVVLVDQFEELYTLCKEPTQRDLFVRMSVSYTHLDVYKRQGAGHPRALQQVSPPVGACEDSSGSGAATAGLS